MIRSCLYSFSIKSLPVDPGRLQLHRLPWSLSISEVIPSWNKNIKPLKSF